MRVRALLFVILLLVPLTAALAPPSAPQTPAAATGAFQGEIDLSWSAPAASGASPVAGYKIYRSLSPTGLTHLIDLGNVLAFTDLGVPDGAPRYYRFSAVNGDGEGPLSAVVSAQALAPPSHPQNFTILRNHTIGRGNLSLVWDAPQWDGMSAVTSYNVYRTPDPTTTPFALLGSTTTRNYLEIGLGDNVTHWYRVTAVNAYGEGPFSLNISGTSPGVPYPPKNVTISSTPVFGVLISWETPDNGGMNIDSYRLYRKVGSDPEKILANMGFNDHQKVDFECPITEICSYRLKAVNSVGTPPIWGASAFSNTVSARGTKLPVIG